jgi:uncharacterized protein RhaS with RHS repeats
VNVIPPDGPRVITYTYDGLYRLKRTGYSTGEWIEYQYDAVGNRVVYTQAFESPVVTNYAYNAANHLTSVNGQAYTWDANPAPLRFGDSLRSRQPEE